MGSRSPRDDDRRRHWEWLLLLLALLMSFACIFFSAWLALSVWPNRLAEASMLAKSQADYGRHSTEGTPLAPLNPNLGAEAATDAARLQVTPSRGMGGTPAAVVLLPPTPTPTATPTPAPLPVATATSTPGAATPISTPTATSAVSGPPTPTTAGTPTPTASTTGTPTPTASATGTPTPTATATGTATPTPTATSSSTPTPTATSTPVPPPPAPTNTPVPPTPVPAPIVQAIAPDTQVNTGMVPVTITGQNFQAGCSVYLGGTLLAGASCLPTTIAASVPVDWVAGYYDLTVTNPDGQSGTLTNAYTATNPIPAVTAIKPNAWFTTSDLPVTITGNNFRNTGAPGVLRATLDGTSLLNVTYTSPTALTAVVPATAMPLGIYTLTVTNPGPTDPTGSLVSAFRLFTYTLPSAVTCTSVDVVNCADAVGAPDGDAAGINGTGVITFDFSASGGIPDGPGYDLAFYEWPNGPGILLDYTTIEIYDGVTWQTLFNWNGVPGGVTGTNVDSYAALGEIENQFIPTEDLYPGDPSGGLINTGVAIDVGTIGAGPFSMVRVSYPVGGTESAQIDALVRLN